MGFSCGTDCCLTGLPEAGRQCVQDVFAGRLRRRSTTGAMDARTVAIAARRAASWTRPQHPNAVPFQTAMAKQARRWTCNPRRHVIC